MLNFNLKKETLLSQDVKSPYYPRIGGKNVCTRLQIVYWYSQIKSDLTSIREDTQVPVDLIISSSTPDRTALSATRTYFWCMNKIFCMKRFHLHFNNRNS